MSANVVAFCRLLRNTGMPVGPAEEVDALRALLLIDSGNPDEFRLCLRTILTGSHRDQKQFDSLFEEFFTGDLYRISTKVKIEGPVHKKQMFRPPKQSLLDITAGNWKEIQQSEEGEAIPGYSPFALRKTKELEVFQPENLHETIALLRLFAKRMKHQQGLRYHNSTRRHWIDFRKTMRKSLRNAGEVIDLAFRERSLRQRRLIVLCDVSGSMENTNRFMLTFLYALQSVYGRIETFTFSTSLHRITPMLKNKNLQDVLSEISKSVQDWSGGTRIGHCLQLFLEKHATSMLDRHSVVLILSDGWDTGDLQMLERSMAEIRRRSGQIIWLNPLLRDSGFQPNCLGMQAALPYIDAFFPAGDLKSLQMLCDCISFHRKRFKYTEAIH